MEGGDLALHGGQIGGKVRGLLADVTIFLKRNMTTSPLPPCSFLTSEDTTQAAGEHEVRWSQESRDTDTANWETPEFQERKMEGKLRWSLDGA